MEVSASNYLSNKHLVVSNSEHKVCNVKLNSEYYRENCVN